MKTWLGTAVLAVLLVTCALLFPQDARGICRIFQPPTDSGTTGVEFDPTTVAVYVLAPDQIVDYTCPALDDAGTMEPDAGTMSISDAGWIDPDAAPPPIGDASLPPGAGGGMDFDAGDGLAVDAGDADSGATMGTLDAAAADATILDGAIDGSLDDAGASDAGPFDAGPPYDPSICPDGARATAIRDTLVSMILQPSVIARGGQAGLVMAVPARADVHIAPARLIPDIRSFMRAHVVETVTITESSTVGHMCSDPHYSSLPSRLPIAAVPFALLAACGEGYDDGGYYDAGFYRPGLDRFDASVVDYGDGGTVSYERIATSPHYDVTVLNASTVDALLRWLDEHGFAHGESDIQAFGHYLHEGAWFVAVHVHPPASGARLALEPLVVTWRGRVMPVLHQLQYVPGGAGIVTTDALVIAPTRMQSADDTDETLYAAATDFRPLPFGLGSGWLTHLTIRRDLGEEIPDSSLVPAAPATVRPTIERSSTVLHPAPCCANGYAPRDGEFTARSNTVVIEYDEGATPPPIPESAFRRRTLSDCPSAGYSGMGCGGGRSGACSIAGTAVSIGWVPVVIGAVWAARLRRRRR